MEEYGVIFKFIVQFMKLLKETNINFKDYKAH